MLERTPKRLTSYLGTAVMFMMVFGVLWQAMPVEYAHAAANGDVSKIKLIDTDLDGTIDRIQLEVINGGAETWSLTGAAPYGFAVNYGVAEVDIDTVSISGAADANPLIVKIGLDTTDTDLVTDTTADNIELLYTQGNGGTNCTTENCLSGTSLELAQIVADDTGANAELDQAQPVIVSAVPSDKSTSQARDVAISWIFSEPMATAGGWVHADEFTSTPDPGSWGTAVWSNGNKTVTVTHQTLACSTSYSIATDPSSENIAAAAGEAGFLELDDGATTPIGEALTFTTAACGSSTTSDIEPVSYSIELLTPNGDEDLTAGEDYEITWDSSHVGTYVVNLYYLDADGTYQEIATGESNDGSYMWMVPSDLDETMIKVAWDDLAEEFESDTSDDTVTITGAETEDTSEEEVEDTEEAAEAPSGTGISPVTGEEEEITAVEPGDFISSSSFSTVYYVTESYERRAFITSQVFFTYADSFDDIKEVTDATLTALTLGNNMLPNPGVVLVKVQSDPKTYAVDDDYALRWITSEEVAEDLYGTSWADYIIDVEATFFGQFGSGDDVESADDLDASDSMKTREELSQ